jgi:endonuclease YncB( thermonuclease family)|tara:strand:- start:399 stop:911 length:513 start_codon:yes stop_codon:yes gene_type:complete
MSLKRLVIVMLFLSSTYSFADFNAVVVNIVDGDTIDVIDNNSKKLRIRLLGIDAPEKKQHFGHESFFYLNRILNGQSVTIISNPDKKKPYTLGYYKRIIGKVVMNGRDINLEMIKKGMAWHFKKYKKSQPIGDRHSYNKAENEARRNNIGLWFEGDPLPPWRWRKLQYKK